jgi:hypothetical protein
MAGCIEGGDSGSFQQIAFAAQAEKSRHKKL